MKSLTAMQSKLGRCAKNQNCVFIETYGGQIYYLLIHLSSLYIWTLKKDFVKENKKPFTASSSCYNNRETLR